MLIERRGPLLAPSAPDLETIFLAVLSAHRLAQKHGDRLSAPTCT
jgi:hypothetical protein